MGSNCTVCSSFYFCFRQCYPYSVRVYRPWEKPAIPQAPPINLSQSAPEPERQLEIQQHDREEPTTVEAPTWDDEPSADQATGPEVWPLRPEPPAASAVPEIKSEVVEESVPEAVITESKPEVETKSPAHVAQAISAMPAQGTALSSPKLTTRPPAASHRTSTRHKLTDQPVTMPVSFSTGIEKVGMQFGSLSLGGDDTIDEPASYVVNVQSSTKEINTFIEVDWMLFLLQNLLLLPLFNQKTNLSRQHHLWPRHLLHRTRLPRYSNNNNLLHLLQSRRQPRYHHKLPSNIQCLLPSLSPYNPLNLRLLMLLLRLLHFSSLLSNRRSVTITIILINNINLKLRNNSNNPNSFINNPHILSTCRNKYNSLMLHSIRMPNLVSPLILIHRNKHNQLHNKLCRVAPIRITSDRLKLCQIPLTSTPQPLLPHNHKTVLMVRSVS